MYTGKQMKTMLSAHQSFLVINTVKEKSDMSIIGYNVIAYFLGHLWDCRD